MTGATPPRIPPMVPAPPTPVELPTGPVEKDTHCVGCSYNLRGLDAEGRCPECGAEVRRSLMGDRLEYSSPNYLRPLYRGVTIVLAATIAQLALMMLAVLVGLAIAVWIGTTAGGNTSGSMWFAVNAELLVNGLKSVFSLVIIYGWWLFSTPDPAIAGDTGATPRKVVRGSAVAAAITSVLVLFEPVLGGISLQADVVGQAVTGTAQLVNLVAEVVLYFASLLYVRWLARRVPDRKMEDFAKLLMWLGPLVYVLGSCLIVGPLVAIILYLILLNNARKAIGHILATQEPMPADAV